ncbi:MAG: hypothetical protein HY847_01260 [Betaproteobacteria bacterium]|nr:hypothetical protein [Betaproteobacteria bacterium]
MKNPIILVEINAYDKANATAVTLRFCDGLAYRLRLTETPANALYRPFLIDSGWSRVDIFSAPGRYAHITPGEVVLDDSSGTLGATLIGYAFDGRSIVIRLGERGAAYPSGYTTILNGTLDGQPSFDWTRITFRPADLTAAMSRTLQSDRYTGGNSLPNGLEGVDDLKGRVKPIVLALASNMTPECVNTSKLIFHVSIPVGTAAVAASAVRDKGVPLTAGTAYANIADLQDDAKAPAAGAYKVLSTTGDGCYFRLGSSPIGEVTCDAAYGASGDRTHAQVWKRILLYLGISSGSISAADVTALDTALSGEIECAYFDETDAATALNEIATSAGAGWYGDATGVYRIVQWAAPTGSPVATLTNLRTMDMDIADPVGTGDVAPAYRVTLQYGRNWTVQQDANLGGDKTSPTDTVRAPGSRAGLAARAWLVEEWRSVKSEDTSVKTAHLNAIELKLTSLLSDATAAQSFSDAQLTLYKTARHMTTLTQMLSPAQIDAIRVNTVVTVTEARWGYDAGRSMRVAGALLDTKTGKSQLSVWG